MTTYTCPRCGYNTYHICAYKKHLQRQKICPAKHAEMSQNDLYEHFTNSFEERKVKVYKCDICNQAFDTPQKKYQHKLRCSSKNVNEQIREQVQQQVKQILSNVNIGNTTNINNNGTFNTINIINAPTVHKKDFGGQENTEYLDQDMLMYSLKDQDIHTVLKELHFNPEHPENHNVRVKNLNQNLMEYIENGKWVVDNKDRVLQYMVMNGWRILDTFYRDNTDTVENSMSETEIDQSLTWLQKIYDEDGNLLRNLKSEAMLMVLNNKALLLERS